MPEFCVGAMPSSMNLSCDGSGTWPNGGSYASHCEAAVNPSFTFDGATQTASGPYLVLSLQVGLPSDLSYRETADTRLAGSSAQYFFRVNSTTLPARANVPIRLPLRGALRAEASSGSTRVRALVVTTNYTDVFVACAVSNGAVCPSGPPARAIDSVGRFEVPINTPHRIVVSLSVDVDGPVFGELDPNGAGRGVGFIDPLPELDTDATPTGLPANWASQVTLELSHGARVGDDAGVADGGLVDAGARADASRPASPGEPSGSGCSAGGRPAARATGGSALLAALALARRSRRRVTR